MNIYRYLSILLILSPLSIIACNNDDHDDNNTCNKIYNALNNATSSTSQFGSPRLMQLFNTFSEQNKPTITTKNDYTTVTFQSGTLDSAQTQTPFRYIDFDSDKVLEISDEDAICKNKDWDIGIRNWYILTNSGILPGSLQLTEVNGDVNAFKAYTSAQAKALNATDFKENNSVNLQTGAVNICQGSVSSRVCTAAGELKQQNYSPFDYDFTTHAPKPRPNVFWVVRDTKKADWYTLFRVESITLDPQTKILTYTVQYRKPK